jgi:hypothetical protein
MTFFRIGSWSPSPDDPERITSQTHYGDAGTQKAFKDALDKAGIPYKLETRKGGEEFVGWTRAHDAAVLKIRRQVDGSDLPSGRSVSFDNAKLQKEFVAWLAGMGVKHETTNAHGREYVVWEGPDNLAHRFMLERPSDCKKTAAAPGAAAKKCG